MRPTRRLLLMRYFADRRQGRSGAQPRHARSQCLDILLGQLHEQVVTVGPAPAIALDATNEPLAVVVDLDEWAVASGTGV